MGCQDGAAEGADERKAEALLRRSIWLPTELMQEQPFLFPHWTRSNGCHKEKCYLRIATRESDAWACSNSFGFAQDDNSLIKNLARYRKKVIPVEGANDHPRGLVACHILPPRYGQRGSVASSFEKEFQVALRNSFVGNLVWLSKEWAVQTDLRLSAKERSPPSALNKRLIAVSWALFGGHASNATLTTWAALKADAPGWATHGA